MMGTYRLARQNTLETVRKEISEVCLGRMEWTDTWYDVVNMPSKTLQREWQRSPLRDVDILLEGLEVRR